jgi:hypothetical protein
MFTLKRRDEIENRLSKLQPSGTIRHHIPQVLTFTIPGVRTRNLARTDQVPESVPTIIRFTIYQSEFLYYDRLCGLVVRVYGYRSKGSGFDSRPYQIFWEVGDLKRGPLSLVRTTEKLLEWKSSGSGLENRGLRPWEFVVLITQHPLPAKFGTNFVESGGRSVNIIRLRTTATGFSWVTLLLAVYRQPVRLGDKPLETHDQ